jgi:hypothetical protein
MFIKNPPSKSGTGAFFTTAHPSLKAGLTAKASAKVVDIDDSSSGLF